MVHDVSHGVQIEAFIHSRLKGREICQRALLSPPPQESLSYSRAPQISLFENFARNEVPDPSVSSTLNQKSKSFVCFCSLRVGELSGFFNPHWLGALQNSLAQLHFESSGCYPGCLAG